MGLTVFRSALLMLLAYGQLAYATVAAGTSTEIRSLRVGHTPGRTRVVFDLSGATPYTLTTLDDPARVVVDIAASTSSFDPRDVPLQGTPIAHIHAGMQPDASLRYVFDVTSKTNPRIFALKPYEGHGHRLVLDLHAPGQYGAALSGEGEAPPKPARQLPAGGTGNRKPPIITPQSATEIPNPVSSGTSGEWSGYISLESRLFFDSSAFPRQDDQNASAAFAPEYYLDWADGRQRFAFSPFFRYDANDDERTHADVRELYWHLEYQQIMLKAGLDVVFWGVTESQHLVDIINQTDLVENIDREDKLGQPMLNLDYMSNDWGTWQFYLLPYFRERTFPGERGRLRTEPVVDTDDPIYDSGDEENHIDFALRWSHYIGDWDVGLAHFSGTSREPILVPSDAGSRPSLVPLYLQIDQTSLDVQATKGAWLWKLEAIYNDNKVEDYFATVGGFEYTHFGLAGTPADLGWLLEYHYDERDEQSTTALQNDIYAGVRLTGNDIAGTRLLAGVIVDTDDQSIFGNIEAVRRLGESWTITVEARVFSNIDKKNPLIFFRDDDYIELQLARFF